MKLKLQGRMVMLFRCTRQCSVVRKVVKDQFYKEVEAMLHEVGSGEPVFVMGDFNARVGKQAHAKMDPGDVGKVTDSGTVWNGACQRKWATLTGMPRGILQGAPRTCRYMVSAEGVWYMAASKNQAVASH